MGKTTCATRDATDADLVRPCSFHRAQWTFCLLLFSGLRLADEGDPGAAAAESGISSDQRAAAQLTCRGRTAAERLINKQMKRFFKLQGGAT